MPDRGDTTYSLDRLRAGLKPFRLHFFPRLRSTNDHAAAMRKRGDLFAPAVILTSRQTAGRGRGSNTWFSAPGSLTVTFVLRASDALAPHHLPLAAGLAARNAAAELTANPDIQLKWPNDLVYAPPSTSRGARAPLRKLAGLLCERLDKLDLIGIGLNVNRPPRALPKPLRDRLVFLDQLYSGLSTQHSGLTDVLIALARHLHATLIRNPDVPFPTLLREYDRHHALLGRRITVRTGTQPPITGKCEGLDPTGRLLVREKSRLHRIIAGHVELT